MTTLRTAAQQALEALELGCTDQDGNEVNLVWPAITALRAALAEPQEPPIGKASTDVGVPVYVVKKAEPVQEPVAWMYTGIKHDGTEHGPHLVWKPAYMDAMSASKGAQATPLYASPQPQQTEPSQDTPPQHEYEVTANDDGTFSVGLPDGEELRIIPPQRKPLTEEEIGIICASLGFAQISPVEVARAIEQAHGITS